MFISLILTTALFIDTPDWREAKTPVPRHWSDKQYDEFLEKAHGDPIWIMRQRYGIERGGSMQRGASPRGLYYGPRYYYLSR